MSCFATSLLSEGGKIVPSKTFYNLSETKRERIIAGAMKEFSDKSFNDVSISSIVKNSNISRGSFYQYFEDKKDLYFYLIGKFRYNYRQLMLKSFKENNGDFFAAYCEFGRKYIKYIRESEKFGFFENMYLHMNYQIRQEAGVDMSGGQSRKKNTRKKTTTERIIESVDRSQLYANTDKEIIDILKYILNILDDTIMEGFWEELTIEETQQLFEKRLGWISYGVLTEKR